jgi:hypothetical protein
MRCDHTGDALPELFVGGEGPAAAQRTFWARSSTKPEAPLAQVRCAPGVRR